MALRWHLPVTGPNATLPLMRTRLPGTYMLILRAPRAASVRVGSVGDVTVEPGWYVYVGSAMGGLWQRVRRHLANEKRLRWHIDYLRQVTQVEEVWFRLGSQRDECAWARALAGAEQFSPFGAIGASDCACRTHVYRCERKPDPAWLGNDPSFGELQRWVPGTPFPGDGGAGNGR